MSIETPTTARPLFRYAWWISMNNGISLMQPPHSVAQRSSNRALPLKLARGTNLPLESSNAKYGAALRVDCDSTATRISAALASDMAARQMIAVRIGYLILWQSTTSDGDPPMPALHRLANRPLIRVSPRA